MDYHPLTFLLTFAGIQALAAISPGPAFAVVTQKSLSGGRGVGLATALGCTVGLAIWLSATMLGFTFLVTKFWWLYTALRIAGGIFLVYLAIQLWRHSRDPLPASSAVVPSDGKPWSGFRAGLFVQLSNPKAFAYCASIVVTLLPPEPELWLKFAIPLVGTLVEGAWWVFVACAFSAGAFRKRYSDLKHYLERAMGAALGVLGFKLLIERP